MDLPLAMGSSASKKQSNIAASRRERIARGIAIIQHNASALTLVSNSIDEEFAFAAERIVAMRGCLIICGIGKAGLIGRKLAATFASTGTRAHFMHPSEAIHGDLGCIGPTDLVLILSNSGSTAEVLEILPCVARRSSGILSITSGANSPLARASDVALILPPLKEACQHNLAPTTSTVAMLALGDALAMVVSEAKGFRVDDFAELHPGGALGRKLATVDELMRPLTECRICNESLSIRNMLVDVSKPGRRSGAVMITNSDGILTGIFTDSDLAKMLEQHRESELDRPIAEVMTVRFSAIQHGARLDDAIAIMAHRKISELPVVDTADRPLGMIDITDVLEIEQTQSLRPMISVAAIHEENAPCEDLSADSCNSWDHGPTSLRIFGPLT